MSKKKRSSRMSMKTGVLFGLAAVLLVFGAAGSSRAALTYFSENYTAAMEMDHVGVTLRENGKDVSTKTYVNGGWSDGGKDGELLTGLKGEDVVIQPTKPYKEELTVRNDGAIDEYVRVTVSRYWEDETGKNPAKLPELIRLHFPESDGWVIDEAASTDERTVLYYTKVLGVGQETPALMDQFAIDKSVELRIVRHNKNESSGENGDRTITNEYLYEKANFVLKADVDAVQTHNATDAIKSAWGKDVASVASDGTLTYEFK